MSLTFYPHEDIMKKKTQISLKARLELLLEGAENYKAIILDTAQSKQSTVPNRTPHDLKIAYNWPEIAETLSNIKNLGESTPEHKEKKANLLKQLAEIYEVLRCAKMPKLEAIRIALISEANQLK